MRYRVLALALFLALAGHFARGQTTQTLSANSQCTNPIDVTGLATLGMQMTGTWSATLQPEVAIGGQAAVNTQVTPSTSSTAQATITGNGAYVAAVGGYSSFLVCVTSYASGSVTIHFQGNVHVNAGLVGGSSGGGFGCSGSLGALTCASYATSGSDGGIIGTEGTCGRLTPATGLDLLCPSSTGGPLGVSGWLANMGNGGWASLFFSPSLVPAILPVGSSGTPSLAFTGHTDTGLYWKSTNVVCYKVSTDTCDIWFGGSSVHLVSNSVYGWASSTIDATAADTGLSRSGAAVVNCGNGTNLDTTCKLQLAGVISAGTKFATNNGCTDGTNAGGATAGYFTVGSTSCTEIITMGNSATAPNGWSCTVVDITTLADVTNPHQTTSSATTATFVTGTVVSGDKIQFSCIGY